MKRTRLSSAAVAGTVAALVCTTPALAQDPDDGGGTASSDGVQDLAETPSRSDAASDRLDAQWDWSDADLDRSSADWYSRWHGGREAGDRTADDVDVRLTAFPGDGTATVTWEVDAHGADVDGVLLGRDGVDTNGTGPWRTSSDELTGSLTFDRLRDGTTYTLYAVAVVDGDLGDPVTVQVTPDDDGLPDAPTHPGTPGAPDPTGPGTPTTPTDPGTPIDPTTPADPGTPTTPTNPGTPTTPTNPGTPTTPTNPGTPTTPTNPGTPTTPTDPGTPTTPGDGSGPTGQVPGSWALEFSDEFEGTSIDTSKWDPKWYVEGGEMNNTPTFSSNVSVAGGQLVLTKQSSSSGALVHTDFPGGHTIGVGDYVEARVNFPGNGTDVYNWAAWWITTTAAEGWPTSGEHDIAEIKGGEVTINYISPSGATEVSPLPAGYWGDAFHTYGIHRKATSADVYFDGRLVATYATSDQGGPNIMVLNVGEGQGSPSANGAEGAMRVDYVRAWGPA